MIDSQTSPSRFQLNTGPLVGGAVLIAAGGLLALVGAALAGSALIVAAQRRVKQMDVPPTELARQKWSQARAATAAGVGAWRNGPPAAETHSS
jgi:hypothetical protein